MTVALAPSPRGLGLLPEEFWRLTPLEFWTMAEQLVEAQRDERRRSAMRIIAMAQAIGGKDTKTSDIWEMVVGEKPPWFQEADSKVLDEIYQQSRVRK